MSSFSIMHRLQRELDVLELDGELDAHTAPQLEEALQNLLNKQKHQIIVNCKELEYISSAGLGVFMAYIEDVRSMGGDIKLTNMKPGVYHVFDLLGFPALYDIFDDEQEAIAEFSNQG